MAINKCRVCGSRFFKTPLLQYARMPKSAQFLPDAQSIKHDRGINLGLYQCTGCGLVQLNSKPVFYYQEVIRAAGVSKEMCDFRKKQFSGFLKRFSLKGKKIIESGCGRGEDLSLLNQSGAQAYGLESSAESVAQCVKNGLKVSKGFVGHSGIRLSYAPFDAFFILSFLEHLPDPNMALKGIYNNLVDGAVGLVEVPNFDMILQKKLFSEFISDHLFYFTKETLNAVLNLNGFEIIECNVAWHEYLISAVVRKREKLDIAHFHEYQVKIKKEIERYICRFRDKKVAIWGAGHQALAVISLMNLNKKIRYVVDSAVFKQGKYTPATHIPIVHPDTLNIDPVDAVIVMVASYSDEVVGIIRNKFNKSIRISILRDFGLEEI